MAVLVTGFEPFAGLLHNPSHALIEHLPHTLGGEELVRATLPVDTQAVVQRLETLYAAHQPKAVLHLGLAQGRSLLSLERVALNLLDFDIPDNAGHRRQDQPVLEGGPLALLTRLPYRDILEVWKAAGIPAQLSNSAGTYLCNQVMYLALSKLPQDVPTGFIHLPPDETLALSRPQPYVPLEVQARAITLALETTLTFALPNQPRLDR